ncbi:MAG: TonB-dependent receptor [Mangrovibacterium sp.]
MKVIWGVSVLLLLINSVYSQNSLDTTKVYTIDSVVVTARPFNRVIPAQSLAGKELETLSSHNVADALRYFAGIQVKDYGGLGGLKTIDVRNMGTHHVGVFYDGIELGNAQNGVVDLGRFSLDDMETLTLYNGQKSEIFQSAKDFAAASTVYLQTKRPRFDGDENTNLTVRYKAMSINYHNPSLRLEQRLGERTSMSFSSEYIKSDGKYKFRYKRNNLDGTVAYDTTAVRQNSDIEAIRVESALFGAMDKGSWYLKAYYFGSDRGAPGAIVANKFSDGYRQNDKNFFVQGDLLKDFSDNYHFRLKAKYAYDYTHYLARDTTTVLGEIVTESAQFDNTFRQQEIYLSAVNMYNIASWWDASLSADLQWNTLDAVLRGVATPFAYPNRYTALLSLATSIDLGKVKAMGSVIGNYVHETVKNGAVAPDKKEITPACFIGYRPFGRHDFTLRAFAKRIFRMPTFNDLYYTQIGSSVLKPEYMNQYDVGFTYAKVFTGKIINRFFFQTDAYHTSTKDKIVAAPTGNLFRWMMSNIGKVKGTGIETAANVDASINEVGLSCNLTYAYTQSKDYTKIFGLNLSSYGDQIPYTPWHSGSAIVNASCRTWNLNYSFIYVGKRYNGAFNNIRKNEVQPWYTHDLSLQKEFKTKLSKITGTVEVNNLLNQHYEVIYNYPMPGRTFRFILNIAL